MVLDVQYESVTSLEKLMKNRKCATEEVMQQQINAKISLWLNKMETLL